jgi:hypothetical protein
MRQKRMVRTTNKVFQSCESFTVQTPRNKKIMDSDELASIFIAYFKVVCERVVMFSST